MDLAEAAELGDDGGQEEGEGAEADVATEVYYSRRIALPVHERAKELFGLETLGVAVTGLAEREVYSDFFLAG